MYARRWVSVRANVRVSGAARRSAREALQIALRAGGFSALVVLGMVRTCCNFTFVPQCISVTVRPCNGNSAKVQQCNSAVVRQCHLPHFLLLLLTAPQPLPNLLT
jgi:Na+/H+-translocating membrane pyrophosphatase